MPREAAEQQERLRMPGCSPHTASCGWLCWACCCCCSNACTDCRRCWAPGPALMCAACHSAACRAALWGACPLGNVLEVHARCSWGWDMEEGLHSCSKDEWLALKVLQLEAPKPPAASLLIPSCGSLQAQARLWLSLKEVLLVRAAAMVLAVGVGWQRALPCCREAAAAGEGGQVG